MLTAVVIVINGVVLVTTKAVVATLVSLSPAVGVGAVGFPVNTGDAKSAFNAKAVFTAVLLGAGLITSISEKLAKYFMNRLNIDIFLTALVEYAYQKLKNFFGRYCFIFVSMCIFCTN